MSDIRDDLNAAYDSASTEEAVPAEPSPPVEPQTEVAPPSQTEVEASAEGRARDEKGRFAKKTADTDAAPPQKPAEQTPAAPPAQAATPPATEQPASQPTQIPKAPQSWRPAAREEWAKVPASIRDEVMRREKEVTQALQESSEARQGYQRFRETIAPFEQMVRAEGGEPLQAIQGLFQTAYALRHAPPQVKAQMITNMVKAYLPGREGLEMLDAALSGQAPAAPAQPVQPQVVRDPRVDAIVARDAERERQRVMQGIEEISKEEFFNDVREDMADLIEGYRRRGLDMTLKEAYSRAVAAHPEVSKVVAQREAARRAATPSGATRTRTEASSLKSNPSPRINVDSGPSDLRSQLEAVVDGLSQS